MTEQEPTRQPEQPSGEQSSADPQYGQPQYGQPQYGQPQYGQHQYGQHQYGQPQYGQPQYGQHQYGYPGTARPTNTQAILSLVFAFVLSPLGIVFGIIAKRQIRERGEDGAGLATAGIVVGSIFTAFAVLWFVLVIALVANGVSSASL